MYYFPNLPYTKNKSVRKSTIEWAGLNKRALIADNQFSATTNLSTKNFPLISPRYPRADSYSLTIGRALFAGPKLAWVDGVNFIYDETTEGTVEATPKCMVDFNGAIYILSDKAYYNYGTDTFDTWGTGSYPTAGSVPDMYYMTTLNNRIWGCYEDNLYACALGDASDWTTFDGLSTDAYAVDTGTNGNFTGISSYKGTALIFKLDRVFKLYGSTPENFQLVEISRLGCTNNKSIVEVNGILFWLSPQGVCAYNGGTPEVISEDLNENYTSGVAGGDGRKYYISLYNGTDYNLYVYDTWKGIWLQEDSIDVTDFALYDGYLYALVSEDEGSTIYRFDTSTPTYNDPEVVEWDATTKQFTEEISNKKGCSELSFRVDLDSGSSLQVYVKVDNGSYTLMKSYSTTELSSFRVALPIRRADHFTVKLVGKGECKVYAMERKFYVGTNV